MTNVWISSPLLLVLVWIYCFHYPLVLWVVLLVTHIFHTRFKSFEDYLDSLVIEDDQKFLKDVDTARVIAQLGYRLVSQMCSSSSQVFRKNTLGRGVSAAEGGDCCVKELWKSQKRGSILKLKLVVFHLFEFEFW